jgi:hypothetical protein
MPFRQSRLRRNYREVDTQGYPSSFATPEYYRTPNPPPQPPSPQVGSYPKQPPGTAAQ